MFKTATSTIINNVSNKLLFATRCYGANVSKELVRTDYQFLDTRSLPNGDFVDTDHTKVSVLEECKEDIEHVAPYLRPTFNFAAYVNKSETLQQLVKLGVNLHRIEKTVDGVPFIMKLDFEKDIKNHIQFLCDRGVDLETVAEIFSNNPLVLKEDLDDLEVRMNYLESKRFNKQMIARILSKNHFWLSFR